MSEWLMKTADDEYVIWSTIMDEIVEGPMTRDEALREYDSDRVEWTDKHLCSCRARLGETTEIRNGRPIVLGGGALAYHFDSYAEINAFMT